VTLARRPTTARTGTGYEPIVDLRDGTIVGYAGPHRSGSSDVAPSAWLAALLATRADLPPGRFLTINIDPPTLVSDAVSAVFDAPHDLDGVVIELTERSPAGCPVDAELKGQIARHRSRGARIALDHAGSGYAGLARILEVRPSILKVERQLVRGLDRDEAKRMLVELLVRYADHLHALVLAEEVGTLAELEALRQLQVPLGQGPVLRSPGDGWAGVAPGAAELLGTTPVSGPGHRHIGPLIERVPITSAGEGPPAGDGYSVATDHAGTPVALCPPPINGRAGAAVPPLLAPATMAVVDLARQALGRPTAHRFDPVICIDPDGRALGIVRIERVLDLLAREAGPGRGTWSPPPPPLARVA
jgi:EAL domain-containing protein (putative c-di-GMP-specific phosphodiesterase class I)